MPTKQLTLSPLTEEDKARFWAKVEKGRPNQCWPWFGAKNNLGYGRFKLGGATVYAHHVAFALGHGAPAGCLIRRTCEDPSCVNPAHLFDGRRREKPKPKRGRRSRAVRPKPTPDFPLFHHASGRWAKKVLGRLRYFGKVADDPDGEAAIEEWLRVRDDLLHGRKPRPKGATVGLTVGRLCNLFLSTLDARIGGGSMAPRARREYRKVTDRLVSFFGPGRSVEDLRPDDFEALLRKLPKTWGQTTRGLFIGMARAVFNYASNPNQRLIPHPVPFGDAFVRITKKQLRRHRARVGQRLFTPEELRKAIDAAGSPFKAALLLGINCGFGNTDISEVPWSAIHGEWIDFPRPKTGEPRRAWLWPETREALDEVRKQGRKPADPADAHRVFLTRYGKPWVRLVGSSWSDAVCNLTRDVFKKAGVEGRSFYDCRRTFRTVADETLDAPAINLVMGHADPSMGAVYRQRIADERIKRVCEHVRAWLFGEEGGEA